MVQTKEEKAASKKKWYQANKEKKAAYYQVNKEKIAVYRQTPARIKSYTIFNWKSSGLLDSDGDNYEKLYNHYLATDLCDVCRYVFDNSNWRCLDHNHETRLFRQVLCHKCNLNDSWKNNKC